jgi:Ribosomal protein L9, N-terminal domain
MYAITALSTSLSSLRLTSTRGRIIWNLLQPQPQQIPMCLFRWRHTVRVILTEANVYHHNTVGSVLHVTAGMARNYLIPQKKAIYAIPENFERLGLKDPAIETDEERQRRLAQEAADAANLELIAANVLEKYLKNKTVRILSFRSPRSPLGGIGLLVAPTNICICLQYIGFF